MFTRSIFFILFFISLMAKADNQALSLTSTEVEDVPDISSTSNCYRYLTEEECNGSGRCYWNEIDEVCKKHWMP